MSNFYLSIFINNASPVPQRQNFLRLKNLDITKNMTSMLIGNVVSLKNALNSSLKLVSK